MNVKQQVREFRDDQTEFVPCSNLIKSMGTNFGQASRERLVLLAGRVCVDGINLLLNRSALEFPA